MSEGVNNFYCSQINAAAYGVAVYTFYSFDRFTVDGQALDVGIAACFARTGNGDIFDIWVASRSSTIDIDPFYVVFQHVCSCQALCIKIN